MSNYDDFIVGGQITAEGRELGIEEDDLAGGQLKPEARARLDAAAEEPKKEAKAAAAPAKPKAKGKGK